MSIAEAQADNVRIEKRNGRTLYHPRCYFCMKELETLNYLSRNHYTCDQCKPQIKLFKEYYADRESKTLTEAIHREQERKRADAHDRQ